MDFRILGAVEVFAGGQPLRLGGPRQRALLAYLLLHADESTSAERLVEELWHEPPQGGVAAIQSHVSRLRRALGGRITTSGNGYVIELEPGELDLDRFRALLAEAGATGSPADRARLLRTADDLWRGPPLDGLDAPFVSAESHALEELRTAAVEARLDADLAVGGNGELIAELSALVKRHPLREQFRAQLILALYRNNRQAEALEVYQQTRRMLNDELGLEPGPALRELERAILRHDPSLAPAIEPESERVAPERRGARRRLPLSVAVGLLVLAGAGAAGALTAAAFFLRTGEPQAAAAAPPVSVVSTTSTRTSRTQVASRHRHRTQHVVRHSDPTVTTTHTQRPVVVVATTTTTTTTARPAQPRKRVVTQATTTHTTTTTTTRAKSPAPPKPVTISDTFGGAAIDSARWYEIRQGSGWDFSQRDGHLEFSFQPGTTPGPPYGNFGGHVGTLCKFPGDFDARVDYSLAQWPDQNGIALDLWAFLGPGNQPWSVWRQSSPQGGEQVGSSTGPGVDTALSIDDTAATLRIARHNGVVTAYVLHNGRWVTLTSAASTSWATIGVGALGVGQNPTFGNQPVVVDYDNFRVTADKPVCP